MNCPVCGKEMKQTNVKWVSNKRGHGAVVSSATYECSACKRSWYWDNRFKDLTEVQTLGNFVSVSVLGSIDLEDLTEDLEKFLSEDIDF